VAKLHVEGNIHTSGLITASNIRVLGDYVILDTITSNTEQMVITNDGTGPALKVTQTGNNSIAEFYDDGNALAFKVANDGLIGIGTATPQAKLHVVGSVKATTSISSDTQFLGQSSDTATAPSFSFAANPNTGVFQPAPSNLAVTTNGTERMRVLANGNVGIGTTDPQANMHIHGFIGNVLKVTGFAPLIDLTATSTDNATRPVGISVNSFDGQAINIFAYQDANTPSSRNVSINKKGGNPLFITSEGAISMSSQGGANISLSSTNSNVEITGNIRSSGNTSAGTQFLGLAADTVGTPSYSWTDDSNTGMYHPGADKLGLVTGGVERVSVLDNGNVGIGTTIPQAKLQIYYNGNDADYGILTIQNTQSFGFNTGAGITSGLSFRSQWAGDGIYPAATMGQINCVKESSANFGDSFLSLHTRYTADRIAGGVGVLSEKLRITSTGNVGIGTTAPSSLLSVEKNTADDSSAVIRLANKYGNSSVNPLGAGMRLVFNGYRDGNPNHEIAAISAIKVNGDRGDYLVNGGEIHFSTNPGISPYPERGNVQMVINQFGNVGIGTISPSHRLHVNGDIVTSGVLCANRQRLSFNSPSDTNHTIYNNYANLDGEGSFDGMKMNVYAGLDIRTGNSVGATPALRMRINSDGNVGIGTTNPQAKLHVNGSVSIPSGQLLCPGVVIGHAFATYGAQFTLSNAHTSFTNTNLSVTYTPKSNNSRIYVWANFQYQAGNGTGSVSLIAFYVNIHRTIAGSAAVAGSATKFYHDPNSAQNDWSSMDVMDTFLNSSTTSQTFALYVKEYAGTGAARGSFHGGTYGTSIITLLELSN
jgi:hypothetical protein